MLAALLLHSNQIVSLDRFADLLWPAETAARATASLPVYIANLRRLLEPGRPARTPPERILTRTPGYLLRVGPGEYDIADFESLAVDGGRHLAAGRPRAARAALSDALALWRGRALEEFPFAELEATRLEGLRVAAVEDRIVADLALGDHISVVSELESLVQEHSLRERLVGLLMLALYRSGRQGEALRAYTTARLHLDRELGIEPGPELRRLESDILAQSSALDWHSPPSEGANPQVRAEVWAPSAAAPDPFVGRTSELAAIDARLGRLAEGSGGTVLVSGEPGIGKTRLVGEAVDRAGARGCIVAWGRCEEGDGSPPFWPWIQVIRSLLDADEPQVVAAALAPYGSELGQFVPEVKEVIGEVAAPVRLDPAAARFRLFEAVAGFMGRLATHRPLVVVLDDLHWADPPSLQLTAHVAGGLAGSRIRLVVTYRDVDPAPDARLTEVLALLARHPARLDLSLHGLTREEVGEFIAQHAGAEPAAGVVAAVWARAAGNPFFVGELTRLLLAEKALTEEAAATATVPWAVRQVVGRRVERLPDATRQLLLVAAVAGNDFDLRVVAAAAGIDLEQALDLVDLAVAAGVVTEHEASAERFRFSHTLVQETVYGGATRLRRARLHGLVADALEAVGEGQPAAIEVAHHLYEAVSVTGPARAVSAAQRASTAAQDALAYEIAEHQLRRATDLVATMPAGRERDRLDLDVQIQLAALLSLVRGVAVVETAEAWGRAMDLCREVEDRRLLVPSLWGLLSFAWANGDLAGARTFGEHILQVGQASSEDSVVATADLGLGSVALCAGDLDEGIRRLTTGKEAADALPDHLLANVTFADLRVQVDSWLGMARHLQGDHTAGRMLIDGALDRARALGDPFTVAIGTAFGVFGRILGDDVAGAGLLAEELGEIAGRYQLADFSFHGNVGLVWAAAQALPPRPAPIQRAAEVLAMVEALPAAGAAGIRPWRPFWLALIAEVWQRLGHLDRAIAQVDEGLAEVAAMGASFCAPELLRLRGELRAATAGEGAPADLRQAERLAAEQGAVIYRHRAAASSARIAAALRAETSPPPGAP